MKLDIPDDQLALMERAIDYYSRAEFVHDDPNMKQHLGNLSKLIKDQRYEEIINSGTRSVPEGNKASEKTDVARIPASGCGCSHQEQSIISTFKQS